MTAFEREVAKIEKAIEDAKAQHSYRTASDLALFLLGLRLGHQLAHVPTTTVVREAS